MNCIYDLLTYLSRNRLSKAFVFWLIYNRFAVKFVTDQPAVYKMLSMDTSLLNAADVVAVRVLWAENFPLSMLAMLSVIFLHLDSVSHEISLKGFIKETNKAW